MSPPELKSLREQLHRERERGSSIWVPELENREMEGLPLDEAEAALWRGYGGASQLVRPARAAQASTEMAGLILPRSLLQLI
jgi:hypothetical protein